ncbi:MAG: DUF3299 domain-containing protein [Chromatiales bacterium]
MGRRRCPRNGSPRRRRQDAGRTWDTVWVTGTLNVEVVSSELGRAGYRLEARQIDPYQVKPGQHSFRPE